MSMDMEEVSTPRPQKRSKHNDGDLKKRKRDAEIDGGAQDPSQSSKRKRRRREETNNGSSIANIPQTGDTVVSTTSGAAELESPFFEQTTSFYLPLSPIGLPQPLESLCAEHLSPLLLTYYAPLKGIFLSYKNVRLSTNPHSESGQETTLGRSINEYAFNYLWLTAEFTVLRPIKGAWVDGHITVQSETHLGLVCWNHFNASIEVKRLPSTWSWKRGCVERGSGMGATSLTNGHKSSSDEEDDYAREGYFVDGDGEKVDGIVKFRVRDFETTQYYGKERGLTSIKGTLLNDEEEARLTQTHSSLRRANVDRQRSHKHRDRTRERYREDDRIRDTTTS